MVTLMRSHFCPIKHASKAPARALPCHRIMSWAETAAGAALLVAALGCSSSSSAQSRTQGGAPNGERPNIVIIVADDLGYSDLSSFGSEIPTPNLDGLMALGVQLTNFHTAPTCSPTRAMLMTGSDNHLAGVGTMAELVPPEQKGIPGYEGVLNGFLPTLPALLQAAGYQTFMSGKWHLGRTQEQSPARRGFDRSFALLEAAADNFSQGGLTPAAPKATYRDDGVSVDLPKDFHYSSDYYTGRMISYLEGSKKNQPFFAYLAYTAPHWPLQAPDPYLARFRGAYDKGYEAIAAARLKRMKDKGLIARSIKPHPGPKLWPSWKNLSRDDRAREARRMEVYAAMVANLDDNVGRFIRYLKATNRYENTIFVFFSDNGAEGSVPEDISDRNVAWIRSTFNNSLENMGRAGSFIGYGPNWARVGSAPFRLFKTHTYEGGIRTPAFITGPHWRQGRVSNAYVNVKDIAPTLLAAAGAEHPSRTDRAIPAMQGASLLAFLHGETEIVHGAGETHCLELFGRVAVQRGQWKLTYSNPPWGTGRWEIFDIANDPTEQRDLALSQPELLAPMLEQWEGCRVRNHINWTPEIAAKYGYGNINRHFGSEATRKD